MAHLQAAGGTARCLNIRKQIQKEMTESKVESYREGLRFYVMVSVLISSASTALNPPRLHILRAFLLKITAACPLSIHHMDSSGFWLSLRLMLGLGLGLGILG